MKPKQSASSKGNALGQSIAQSTAQGGQGDWNGDHDPWHETGHPSITDLMWADPGVMSGIITDLSAIEALAHNVCRSA